MSLDPPKVSTSAQSVPQNTVGVSSKIEMLKISEILPDSNQPRRYFDKQQLEELKALLVLMELLLRFYTGLMAIKK